MIEPIIIIDSSEFHEGRIEELKKGMKELAEFVQANEPRMIAYTIYFDEKSTRMTVLQVHPDPASAMFHLKTAAPLFSRFVELITMREIDIYGDPGHELMERLMAKAHLLGSGTVVVNHPHTGFTRFGNSSPES